jgi:hypothetical protein
MKAHTHFKHTINPSGRYVLTARWRAERFYALLKQSAAAVPITGFLCTKAPMLRVPDKRSGWHRVGWAPPGVGPPRPRGSAFGCLPGGPSPLGREGGSAPPELPVVLSSHQNWEFYARDATQQTNFLVDEPRGFPNPSSGGGSQNLARATWEPRRFLLSDPASISN